MVNHSSTNLFPIKRALISVSHKEGVVELARALHQRNIEILSTGGTAALLRNENIPCQDVSDYTGFPEIMGGRVKTLHPKIHGALLGRRDVDAEVMHEHDIIPIDLVIVNLYPFAETIRKPDCQLNDAIEQIDIGGPCMLRGSAKNYKFVTTIVDTKDYPVLLEELEKYNGATTLPFRFRCAQKVFAYTAHYDAAISNYLNQTSLNDEPEDFPKTYTVQFVKKMDLRYGENPHQRAAMYVEYNSGEGDLANIRQYQGKELSFNNIADTNAALECVKSFKGAPACVIVKHANPCGVAIGETQLLAYQRAFATDPTSAFGGIIAFNETLQAATAKAIVDNQFAEVIIAPEIEKDAITALATKPNIRVLTCGHWQTPKPSLDCQRIAGGILIQDRDVLTVSPNNLKIVTERQPSVQEFNDLLFAWEVAKCVKSNAIVYARDRATVGIGAGQMSRVFSTIIAGLKASDARLEISGSVMASDAFFPFRDGIDTPAKEGITAIIQPGGSIRDQEVIQAANEAGIAMVFTGIRHFKH